LRAPRGGAKVALATTAEIDFKIDAMLCDAVAVESGKLYMQGGGWNMVMTTEFPAKIARIGVAALIHVPYSKTNALHRLLVQLQDDDGNRIPLGPGEEGMLEAQFNVGRPPTLQAGEEQLLPFAVNLDALSFSKPGTYSFVFTLNSDELARLTFRITGPPGIQFP
jgi:hypothetical protein